MLNGRNVACVNVFLHREFHLSPLKSIELQLHAFPAQGIRLHASQHTVHGNAPLERSMARRRMTGLL
jgi:hypothetical protein